MIFDLAADFIDMEERSRGETCVLRASSGWSGLDPNILNLLLSREANILVRDHWSGRTCLHNAVEGLSRGYSQYSGSMESKAFLVVLLRAGLKVTDEDNEGDTPWDLARQLCHERRKVFKDALTECGIDWTSLFVDGEECPGGEFFGQYDCYCETDSEKERPDEEQSDQSESSVRYQNPDEIASARSEATSGEAADDSLDQPMRKYENGTANALSGQFAEAKHNGPKSQATQVLNQHDEDNSLAQPQDFDIQDQAQWLNPSWLQPDPAWDYTPHAVGAQFVSYDGYPARQSPYQDSLSYYTHNGFNTLPTINSFQPIIQQDPAWYPMDAASRPLFTDEHASRTPMPIDTNQAAQTNAAAYEQRTHTSSGLLPPPDLEQHYTYSSTSAWASNSHSNPDVFPKIRGLLRTPTPTRTSRRNFQDRP
jgi:hypothetical protein